MTYSPSLDPKDRRTFSSKAEHVDTGYSHPWFAALA
jgi:hypothetical protein